MSLTAIVTLSAEVLRTRISNSIVSFPWASIALEKPLALRVRLRAVLATVPLVTAEDRTVIVSLSAAEPRGPVHVRTNVDVLKRVTVSDPEIGFVPDHAPEALHEVACADVHERVEMLPTEISAGFATRVTDGNDGISWTVTVTLSDACP